MTEATKLKLRHWDIELDVADKLEAVGILTPADIKQATNKQLEEAGLSKSKVAALRKKLPKVQETG